MMMRMSTPLLTIVFATITLIHQPTNAFVPRSILSSRNGAACGIQPEQPLLPAAQMSPDGRSYEEQMDDWNNNYQRDNSNTRPYTPSNDDYRASERNAAFRRAVEAHQHRQQQQGRPPAFHTVPQAYHTQGRYAPQRRPLTHETPAPQAYDDRGRPIPPDLNNHHPRNVKYTNPIARAPPVDPYEYRQQQRTAYVQQLYDPEAYWREQRNLAFQRATQARQAREQQERGFPPPVEWLPANGVPVEEQIPTTASADDDVLFPSPEALVPLEPEAEISPMGVESPLPEHNVVPPPAVEMPTETPSSIRNGIKSLDEAVAAMHKLSEDEDTVVPKSNAAAAVPPPLITLPVEKASKVVAAVPKVDAVVPPVYTTNKDDDTPVVVPSAVAEDELQLPIPPVAASVPTNKDEITKIPAVTEKKDVSPPKVETVVAATIVTPPPQSQMPPPRVLKDTIETTAVPVEASKDPSVVPPAAKNTAETKMPVAESSTMVPPASKKPAVVDASKVKSKETSRVNPAVADEKVKSSVSAASAVQNSADIPPVTIAADTKSPSRKNVVVADAKVPSKTTKPVPTVAKAAEKTKAVVDSKTTADNKVPDDNLVKTVVPSSVTKKTATDEKAKVPTVAKAVSSVAKKTDAKAPADETNSVPSKTKSVAVPPVVKQKNVDRKAPVVSASADETVSVAPKTKVTAKARPEPVSKVPSKVVTTAIEKPASSEKKVASAVPKKPALVDAKPVVATTPTKNAKVSEAPVMSPTKKATSEAVSKQKIDTDVKESMEKTLSKHSSSDASSKSISPPKKATKETTVASSKDIASKDESNAMDFAFFADEKVVANGKKVDMDAIAVDAAAAAIMNQSGAAPTPASAMFDEDTEKLLERAMQQLESTQKEMSDVKEMMIQAPSNATASAKPRSVKPPLPKEAPPKELMKDAGSAVEASASKKAFAAPSKSAGVEADQTNVVAAKSKSPMLDHKSDLLSGLDKKAPGSLVFASESAIDPDSRWFSAEPKDGVEPRTLQGVALATAFLSTFVVGSAPIVTAAAVPAAAYLAVCRGTTGNLARELGNMTMNCVEPLVTTNATAQAVTSAAKLVKQGLTEISSIKPPRAVKEYFKKPLSSARSAKKNFARKVPLKNKETVNNSPTVRGDFAKLNRDELAKEELAQEIAAQIKKDKKTATNARLPNTAHDTDMKSLFSKEDSKRNTMKNNGKKSPVSSVEASGSKEEADTMLDDVRSAVITKVGKIDEPQPFAFLDPEARAEVNARALLAKRLELQRLEANRMKN